MKVLIIGLDYFHYASSLVKACEILGNQVMKIWITEFRDSGNAYWKIRANKFGFKIFEKNYNIKMNKDFIEKVESFKPDLCIIINGNNVNTEFLGALKKQSIKSVLFMIDSIQSDCFNHSLDQVSYYDKVFSYEPSDVNFLLEKYAYKNAKYLFLGYDETIFQIGKERKEFDICFVGTLNKKRYNLLEKVAQYAYENNKKMIIYTKPLYPEKNIWHKLRNYSRSNKMQLKYPYLNKYLKDTPVHNEELANLYRKSKVCINIHSDGCLHTGPNPRTFEILGCGSFELVDTNHLNQLELKNKQHLVEFEDEYDLCEKIDYYLHKEEEREAIASMGNGLVRQKYTMRECMKKILDEF